MLKFVVIDNFLVLQGLSNLEGHHLANLKFWGFQRINNEDSFKIDIGSAENILSDITEYLEGEEISFSLCPDSNKILRSIKFQKKQFEILKINAKEFKEGNLEGVILDDIITFLKSHIKRPLKDHQIKAAIHFYLLGNAANFSVPGSGKTSVVLSVYEKLRLEGKVNTLFVVGPLSCFSPWREEFDTVLGRNPACLVLAGGSQDARKLNYYADVSSKVEVYFTSYQTLLFDKNEVKMLFEQKGIKAMMVVDEAHYIKKVNGEWAKAILDICRLASHRVVLTGTPLPRSYTDVFNLFDFLWPLDNPIPSEIKQKIKRYEEKKAFAEAKDILQAEIGALFYRVRKKDLGLTEQNFIPVYRIKMNDYERKVYDAIFTKIKEYTKHEYFQNISIVSRLCRSRIMRLRQSLSYCKLLGSVFADSNDILIADDSILSNIINNYDLIEIPAKISALLDLIKLNKGKKIVIWSNFIATISLIENHIMANGYNCKKISGSTPVETEIASDVETREKIRDEFVSLQSGLDILIANPAACSESISLHKTCHTAIYYDLSYNCAQYLQSLDRIHRVGGSEEVIASYYFLQYSDTIETDIIANLEEKRKKMMELIDDDCNIYSLDMFEDDGDLEAYERLFFTKSDSNEC